MKGICQTCGATAPIEWFLTTTKDRQCMQVLSELPQAVSHQCLHYLVLFKPRSGRAMTAAKAQRVLTELKTIVETGFVKVKGRVGRPCPPAIWALAMEQMVERRDQLDLPLENHNYLRKVAWGLADKADYQKEKKRIKAEQSGGITRPQEESDPQLAKDAIQELKNKYPAFRDEEK